MTYTRSIVIAVFLSALGVSTSPAATDYVWWEGESPTRTNFPKETWFSGKTFPTTRNAVLSGGDWLTNAGKRTGPEAFAEYKVTAPADGEYSFWARKFWKHGPFRWRFDSQEWRTCGRDIGLADSAELQQFVSANWVSLGKVKLTRGAHTFELRLLAKEGEELTGCFDCFLLTEHAFVPRGKLKPGEKSGLAEPGWWAFEPPADVFGGAALDLRGLNENHAGETGFVGRKGPDFVLGNGKPVRFWAVNCGGDVVRLGPGPHEYLARRLAKVGVNMVRVHSGLFDANAPDPATVDARYLDDLHHFVAALANEGIYVELSFYFPVWFDVKPTYGIPGYDTIDNKKPFALLTFDGRMQEIYKSWARALLTTKNPYTGLPLGKDPAVALVEIINEDSYLFWTFSEKTIPRPQRQKLETIYGDWLVTTHGSLDGALRAWGGRAAWKTDSLRDGRMGLLDAWHFTSSGVGKAVSKERMSDQLRFLVEHQKGFYDGMVKFFRKDLGAKNLISCSNWQTADARTLDALERYTYTAGDVIDRHGYFGGEHKGPRTGWSLSVGDTFTDRAGVLEPPELPIQVNQVDGFPHIISEIGWPNPNRYRAEFPFLAAGYGSLEGLDGIFFFAVSTPDWESWPGKFPASVPSVLGQFPALALMYRRGDVAEAPVVAHEALRLDDLYAFKGSAAVVPQNLDELRKADLPSGGGVRGDRVDAFDPLSFYVGRVTHSVDGDGSKSFVRDLSKGVDRAKKVVRSATGALEWDYGAGVVAVNTAKTQGVTGFLARKGRIELADVVIESKNEFATVVVTSLDDKPIGASGKVLIQAMTEEKTYGWKAESGKIRSLGGYPMNVRNIDVEVTFKRRDTAKTVSVLDEHGYARGELKTEKTDKGLRIRLAPDALYTVVEQ